MVSNILLGSVVRLSRYIHLPENVLKILLLKLPV